MNDWIDEVLDNMTPEERKKFWARFEEEEGSK